jgi:putative ABC transport system permease protein
LKDVLDLKIVQGRWFSPSDSAVNYWPVVINERLRDDLFGSENPLGKEFHWPRGPRKEDKVPLRIVGVITDFRQHGEFHDPYNYCFFRSDTSKPAGSTRALAASLAMINMLVKLRPGTPAAFEEKVMARLRAVVKDRTIQIEPLARARKSHMRLVLGPIVAGGLVAVFLIIMVGLGMVGVLWQNVSRRTKEIGLRRAVGGTARSIHLQVLGELLVVASVGLLFGVAIVIQFPLLEIVDWFSPEIYLASILISVLLMYVLTILAGLYPGWLATKVQPASALHYE